MEYSNDICDNYFKFDTDRKVQGNQIKEQENRR